MDISKALSACFDSGSATKNAWVSIRCDAVAGLPAIVGGFVTAVIALMGILCRCRHFPALSRKLLLELA